MGKHLPILRDVFYAPTTLGLVLLGLQKCKKYVGIKANAGFLSVGQ